jgi:hypothetical protein
VAAIFQRNEPIESSELLPTKPNNKMISRTSDRGATFSRHQSN